MSYAVGVSVKLGLMEDEIFAVPGFFTALKVYVDSKAEGVTHADEICVPVGLAD